MVQTYYTQKCQHKFVEPVSVSDFNDAATDDKVATVASGRRCGEVDGHVDAVHACNRPLVDSVEQWTVSTATDQLDHLRVADDKLISVSTRHTHDAH